VTAPVTKRRILDALLSEMTAEVNLLLAAAALAYEGATHEESKPENDKDTRALEASYLARGQANRVEEMNETITRLKFLELRDYTEEDPIGATALVIVEIDAERKERFFLVPHGGGRTVDVDGETIRVVTTASPVGRELLGKHVGDDFTLTISGRRREYVVDALR
jgi:transcription elongation GreA/GreB family factor